jgi:glycosyltransferase involved in cell wall biosynthesis
MAWTGPTGDCQFIGQGWVRAAMGNSFPGVLIGITHEGASPILGGIRPVEIQGLPFNGHACNRVWVGSENDSAQGEMIYSQSGTGAVGATHGDFVPKRDGFGLKNAETVPLVSVVVTCYNSARYLAEAVTSALAQTYAKIEIIVVDDGSSDSTATIAQNYPVTYVYQENQGVSAARNTGLCHSQGKYVLFLDHDDRLLPNAIEVGVGLLEQHPECAMAVGEHRYIGANGTALGRSNKYAVGRNHYLMLLKHNFIETPCSVLHRRSALPKTGVFDKSVNGAEDYELYLRIARHSKFIVHGTIVSEYRLHDSSLSRDAERMMVASYRVLQMELPHLQGDRMKLRQRDRGVRFVQRYFGRRLAGELIRKSWLTNRDKRRKLKILRTHYFAGFVVVTVSRLLPARLLNTLILFKRRPTGMDYGRVA